MNFLSKLFNKMGHTSLDVDTKDGAQQYIEELNANAEQFAEEEKKLVRKIDLFLLPTIWIMYLLSYMDRTKYVLYHQRIVVDSC